jgi:hemerythrin superfamily protein
MDAIQLLIHQHRMLERALAEAMDSEPDHRAALFAQAADHLTLHVTSEEQVFYPAVKAARTEDVLLESLEEHLSLKRVLADMLAIDPADKTFEAKLHVLKEQAEHHHKEEEEHLFPKVQAMFDKRRREELGKEMMGLQQRLKREGEPRVAVAEQTDAAPAI